MKIKICSKEDFDQILTDISDFWGSDRTLHLHHPMFVYEFGNSAYVVKENNTVIAYLFGFISQTAPVAYIHLSAVRQLHQRKGLGHKLYNHFIEFAKSKGCKTLKAVTSPNNKQSIAFHEKFGMSSAIVNNYSGIGIDRIVFKKSI